MTLYTTALTQGRIINIFSMSQGSVGSEVANYTGPVSLLSPLFIPEISSFPNLEELYFKLGVFCVLLMSVMPLVFELRQLSPVLSLNRRIVGEGLLFQSRKIQF